MPTSTASSRFPPASPARPRACWRASDRGLLVSGDSGATWAPLGGELGTASFIQGLAADATSSLIVAGNDRRMYRSQDLGASWAPANSGLRSTWIRALALDPSNPSNLWAGALGNGVGGPGLFHSMDAGLSWSPAGRGKPADGRHRRHRPRGLLQDPRGKRDGGLPSKDGGATWSSSRPSQYGLYALAIDPESTERVFAGTREGLMRSEDGGRTWIRLPTVAQAVYSLLFDQRRPGTIYAGSYYDIDLLLLLPAGRLDLHQPRSRRELHPERGSRQPGEFHRAGSVPRGRPVRGNRCRRLQERRRRDALAAREPRTAAPSPVSALVADPQGPDTCTPAPNRESSARSTERTAGSRFRPASRRRTSRRSRSRRTEVVCTPGRPAAASSIVDLRESPAFPCVPSAARLCLVGNRYALDLVAARKGEARYQPGAAHSLGDRAGYFGLPSATGDPDLPEIIVKMLGEGAFGQPGAAVFYTSLTTLPYGLTVTDTMTGRAAGLREPPRIADVRKRGPGVRRAGRSLGRARRPPPRPSPLSKCSAAASP